MAAPDGKAYRALRVVRDLGVGAVGLTSAAAFVSTGKNFPLTFYRVAAGVAMALFFVHLLVISAETSEREK